MIFRSKIYRFVFGFPDWIEQVDRSYLVINLFNEFVVIMSLVGWLVLNREQKECILQKFPIIGIVMLLAEAFWSIALGLLRHDGDDLFYIRKTTDLQENQGSMIIGDDKKYLYHYIYTYLKGKNPERLIIIFPISYFITQDINGNFRLLNKGNYKMFSNVGTYEELSDELVRNGFSTLRCEREIEDLNNNREVKANDLGKLFKAIIKKEKFSGDIYLLAHGKSNIFLTDILRLLPVSGIISLCATGREFDRQSINFLTSKNIPILFGYVQKDPYCDVEAIEYLEECNLKNIEIKRFDNTDFTFRKHRINKKKCIDKLGYELGKNCQLPPMNPIVVNEILEWLNER